MNIRTFDDFKHIIDIEDTQLIWNNTIETDQTTVRKVEEIFAKVVQKNPQINKWNESQKVRLKFYISEIIEHDIQPEEKIAFLKNLSEYQTLKFLFPKQHSIVITTLTKLINKRINEKLNTY